MATRYKRKKFKKRKDPYNHIQCPDNIYVVPNIPELASDLSQYFRNGQFLSGKGDLGPVYAVCENFIRYGCINSTRPDATEGDLVAAIKEQALDDPVDNFEILDILKIVRKHKKKFKWRKNESTRHAKTRKSI